MALPDALPAAEVARRRLARQDAMSHHVASLWRAESLSASEGTPATIRRALAHKAVLERCALPLEPGELIVGSGHERLAPEPAPAGLADAVSLMGEFGARNFLTHADHAAPNYGLLLSEGLGGLRRRIGLARERWPRASRQADMLESMDIAVYGVQRHCGRWARRLATSGDDGGFPRLLQLQTTMLEQLAVRAPRTLWEAIQLVYIMHCAFQLDDRYAMALGRLDQYLFPFYARETAAGLLETGDALTLMEHLFAKLADRADIQNCCVGGLTPSGEDAVNPLSYLCVEAVRRVGRPGGNLTARISSRTPHDFVVACADCMRSGVGFPAVYNDDIETPALVAQGYSSPDALDYCFVGCIEAFIPGKQAPWADSRFNLLRCVDLALRGGRDGLTHEQVGPSTPDPTDWPAFLDAFRTQMREGIARHVKWVCDAEAAADLRSEELTSPLLSAMTDDCISRAADVNAGGAVYPGNHGIAGMGIGSTADALSAVKRFVYDQGALTLAELRRILDADFAGYDRERRMLLEGPKYGNDNPDVDAIATDVASWFGDECLSHRLPGGGRFWALMAANVQNVTAGREVGATPDGRRAREPLSDAASPSFGRDTNGPTAVIRSVAKLDYAKAPGGNVVNMKLHPNSVAGEAGLQALAALIRTCFDLGGVQLQFNTVGRDVLLDAMEHPEKHRDLVVRVSGFSAYFTRLDRAVQEDVLARTEHRATPADVTPRPAAIDSSTQAE